MFYNLNECSKIFNFNISPVWPIILFLSLNRSRGLLEIFQLIAGIKLVGNYSQRFRGLCHNSRLAATLCTAHNSVQYQLVNINFDHAQFAINFGIWWFFDGFANKFSIVPSSLSLCPWTPTKRVTRCPGSSLSLSST